MVMPRGTRGKGVGPRPHTWVTGPDPIRHEMYTAWLRSVAQAHYRGEQYEITFKQFERIWADHWHRRGRKKTDLMLMRKNYDRPWTTRNVILVDRVEFHRRQGIHKRELNRRRREAQ